MVLLVVVLFLMLICHCVEWLLIFAAETAFLFSSTECYILKNTF